MTAVIPSLANLEENRDKIRPWIATTPVWHYSGDKIADLVGSGTEIFFKLELFQHTGSFKARAAVTHLLNLDEAAKKRGVVAASAGNHAIGVSYAAKIAHSSAKVIMPETASHIKRQRAKAFGAEVILVDSVASALKKMTEIAEKEGRTPIHPFEGPMVALGTGTIGLELMEQIPQLDAVVVPIGGGGLCAGIANAIKQVKSSCQIYGVEPEGADVILRSLEAGKPVQLQNVSTVAESLASPMATPYCFALLQKYVDNIVRVTDAAMIAMMQLLFYEMKLAVEPAAAASLAALCGPLRTRLQGKRVALIVSGTNIDQERYCQLIGKI